MSALEQATNARKIIVDVQAARQEKVLALTIDPSYGLPSMLTALEILADAVIALAEEEAS